MRNTGTSAKNAPRLAGYLDHIFPWPLSECAIWDVTQKEFTFVIWRDTHESNTSLIDSVIQLLNLGFIVLSCLKYSYISKIVKKTNQNKHNPSWQFTRLAFVRQCPMVKTHQNILVTIIRQTQAASAHIGSSKTWERLSFLHFFWLIGSVDYQNRCWLTFLAIERSINRLVVSALSTQQVTGE